MSTSVRDFAPLILVTTFGDIPVFDGPAARPPSIEVVIVTVTSAAERPTGHSRAAAAARKTAGLISVIRRMVPFTEDSPAMPLAAFHPLVQQWFRETLGEPTAAQRRGWESIRTGRHTLIAAPTGSGKTLAAFLSALDDLFRASLEGPLPDEVRVVYVSPLKALSTDIHKNLAEPRRGIRQLAEEAGVEAPRITAAVRTGDTTSSERAAILRRPPRAEERRVGTECDAQE